MSARIEDLQAEIIMWQARIIDNQTKILDYYSAERDEWLPVSLAAQRVGLSPRTIRGLMEQGKIVVRKTEGNMMLVNLKEVRARIETSKRLQNSIKRNRPED